MTTFSRFKKPIVLSALCCSMACTSLLQTVHADPILDKADALLKSGQVTSANAIYQQVLRENPGHLPAELALARIAMRRFEYPKAQTMLEKALAKHPNSAQTAALLGRLYQLWSNSPSGKVADNRRDYRAMANEFFRQAQTLDPTDPMVLSYLAEWQIQQGELVNAERNLQTALRYEPDSIAALQGFVRFYIKTRDLSRAKETALHALELDPMNSDGYFLVAQLLGLANHPVEAVRYAEKSEQLDYGRLPERDYFLASQYEKLGELPKAAQYYETLTIYTPREAQVWLKLGDLYERMHRSQQSMNAYHQALAINPGLMEQFVGQARIETRNERIDTALAQWRRVYNLQSDNPPVRWEALNTLAGLHYLYAFLHPGTPHPELGRDLSLLNQATPPDRNLQLARLKLQIAMQGEVTSDVRQRLTMLATSSEPTAAGEAAFLLGNYQRSTENFEAVDGLSAEEYTRLADKLLLDQELHFSHAFYQRAQELQPSPDLEVAIKRITAKHALARQRVDEGNALFNSKDYPAALLKYEEARRIDRQSDNIYLRLGDTYEMVKQWAKAKEAYDTAVTLSPSLMESKGFAKNYARIQKKATSK